METVAQPPADAELQLLTRWGDPAASARTRKAGVLSVLIHIAAIALILLLPKEIPKAPPQEQEPPHHITPLVEPLTEFTQKAPNKGKISKEFNATSMHPRPRVPAPAGPPVQPRTLTARVPVPPPPAPKAAPPPTPQPKVEAPPKESAKLNLPGPAATPPPLPAPPAAKAPPPVQPQIQAQEKNQSPFESPAGPAPVVPPSQRRIPIPDIGAVIHGGAGGGPAIPVPQPPMMDGSNVELPTLLSDPLGVDFRPYLTRLLATVKRNWLAVWPESARSGRRGKVGVQFAIAKDGSVTKVVWAFQSGTDALDRAAVAAVSMSNPFPPLPLDFRGERIVLQLNFAYNMPKQ